MARKKRRIQRRLRKSDIKRARSTRVFNKKLADYPSPQEVEERYRRYFTDELKMRIVTKSSNHMRLSKMTTTYYKELRLGANFEDKDDIGQAQIWVHEGGHTKQWRYYGCIKFAYKYAKDSRWRWSIELPCYGEGLRWSIIHARHNGLSDDKLETAIDNFIERIVRIFDNGYGLGWVHRGDMRKWTRQILREIADRELQATA